VSSPASAAAREQSSSNGKSFNRRSSNLFSAASASARVGHSASAGSTTSLLDLYQSCAASS
jgi:hypothetical protein